MYALTLIGDPRLAGKKFQGKHTSLFCKIVSDGFFVTLAKGGLYSQTSLRLEALFANIIFGWKLLTVANTLAYCDTQFITAIRTLLWGQAPSVAPKYYTQIYANDG